MAARRYSRQRELVYEAVRDSKAHPTAEAVYHKLKADNPNLSLGTVYRNLTLLAEEGKLVRMPFPVERYDADLRPHSHFRCKGCGAVLDLDLPYDPMLDGSVAVNSPELEIEGHSLIFYGVCPVCRAG